MYIERRKELQLLIISIYLCNNFERDIQTKIFVFATKIMNVTNSDSVPLLRLSFDSKKSALASNAIMSNKDSSLRRKLSSMRCLSLRSIVDEELIDVDSSDNNSDVEDNSINDKDIMIQKSSGRRRALLRTLSGKIILNIQSICSGNSKNKKLHNDGKSVATTRSITKKKVIVSDLPNCKRVSIVCCV